jgi:nucleoside-diphosphate-sugar epimerase
MRVLVTGASGFLGGHIVAALMARGHEVRVLLREGQEPPQGGERAVGRLEEPETLRAALTNIEAVVHAAALVRLLAPADRFWKVNVEGADRLRELSFQAGVSRFLHVSSFLALGPADRTERGMLEPSLEADPGPYFNPYHWTKAEADRRARAAAQAGFPVAIVYPGVVYGPGSLSEGNLLVRHLLDLRGGRVPVRVGDMRKRWSLVHVEDVAQGIAAGLERFRPGARWVLGGENLSLGEMYRTMAEVAGVAVPRGQLSHGVALGVGAVWKLICRVFGGTPRLTADLVRIYRHDWACDSSLAKAELGYRARPFREGLQHTLAWLQANALW